MELGPFYIGDTAELTESYPVTPGTVAFSYKALDLHGNVLVPITPVTPAALGGNRYRVDFDLTVGGIYFWRWASTGTGKAAAEGSFQVLDSQF